MGSPVPEMPADTSSKAWPLPLPEGDHTSTKSARHDTYFHSPVKPCFEHGAPGTETSLYVVGCLGDLAGRNPAAAGYADFYHWIAIFHLVIP